MNGLLRSGGSATWTGSRPASESFLTASQKPSCATTHHATDPLAA